MNKHGCVFIGTPCIKYTCGRQNSYSALLQPTIRHIFVCQWWNTSCSCNWPADCSMQIPKLSKCTGRASKIRRFFHLGHFWVCWCVLISPPDHVLSDFYFTPYYNPDTKGNQIEPDLVDWEHTSTLKNYLNETSLNGLQSRCLYYRLERDWREAYHG